MKKLKIKEKIVDKNGKIIPKNVILLILLSLGIFFVSLILIFALYIIISSPDFDKEALYRKESSVIYYKDGVTELARIGNQDRVLISYDELPNVLIDAIVATEDSRYFQHTGLDLARFMKASLGQLVGKKDAGGASTITMQVVKTTYTSSEARGLAGIVRKFTDIYMSVFKVESNYTKEEILEFYVNSQWFANDGNLNYAGIAGVEQACQYFFGKSVKDISLAEASLIAGMFQNPVANNLYSYPEKARKRQNTVLTLMVNHGYITEEEKEAVLEIPIESLLTSKTVSKNSDNQAAIDYVINDVREKTGIDPANTAMKIVSTIEPKVQNALNSLEKGDIYTFPNEYLQEGVTVTSTEDGSIAGMSGGRNYSAKGTNRAISKRQPGSTAKIIFDYGPAIEYLNWSPATLLLDEESTYSNGQTISNASGKYGGLMTMRYALSNSINIPALKAFQAVYKENPDYIKDFAHSLGIDYGTELYESASIGGLSTGVTTVQMSAAYAAFGRGGYYIEPYAFTSATVMETGKEYTHKYEKVKVMSEETAYLITDMLITAAKQGVGGVSVSGTEVAAKGGTSNVDASAARKIGIPTNATRDAWNITYTSEYSTALWIGYDSTTKEHYLTMSEGSKARRGAMKAIGRLIYSKNKKFEKPDGIIEVEVEKETIPVQLPSSYTPSDLRTTEKFKDGAEPADTSTRFEKLEAPRNGSYTFDGSQVHLTWDKISTPEAISSDYLQNYFNENFDKYASKYYEKRVSYNNGAIGSIGYQVYEKKGSELVSLGRTDTNSFTYPISSGTHTFVIKSAYSIFKSNMSDGLEITVTGNVDSNVGDMINNNQGTNTPTVDNTETDDDL